MAARPKLMMGVGIAIAGLGLIGAGAGATFTSQVSSSNQITSGSVGLSLNGETGSDLHLALDATNLGSHFKPISQDLLLKNIGTLDMASTYLSVTADGCEGGNGAVLAQTLNVTLTEVTSNNKDNANNQSNKVVYDGALCSMSQIKGKQGFTYPAAHDGVGDQLPKALGAGESIHYLLVIQPNDPQQGLPSTAQNTHTTLNLVFSGFDY
jgi:predicted ribosomally synthesized peptide with SipW-like signal peptide